MKDNTPAHHIRIADENANAIACECLMNWALPVPQIVELFGGMGRITEAAVRRFPKATIYSYDLDELCCATLRERFKSIQVIQQDSVNNNQHIIRGCGVLADFNLMTLLRAKTDMLDFFLDIKTKKPTWLILTDSAVGKLHLNKSVYGVSGLNGYLGAWEEFVGALGYRVYRTIQPHSRSIMMLITRNGRKNGNKIRQIPEHGGTPAGGSRDRGTDTGSGPAV